MCPHRFLAVTMVLPWRNHHALSVSMLMGQLNTTHWPWMVSRKKGVATGGRSGESGGVNKV